MARTGRKEMDISGKKFGRLTAIARDFSTDKWKCVCECGKVHMARSGNLRNGTVSSCGCLGRENSVRMGRNLGQKAKRHGESGSRIHGIWCHMKTRCLCDTSQAYSYYGGRGIKVCQEWIDSYESFRDWALANGYTDKLELDRRDTNDDYCPENCRWATRVQQMRNTRKRRDAETSKFKGVSWCANASKWRVQLHLNGKPVHVGLYDDEEQAARMYDEAARKNYGDFAFLNFSTGGVLS
jgi:hypothetical protein